MVATICNWLILNLTIMCSFGTVSHIHGKPNILQFVMQYLITNILFDVPILIVTLSMQSTDDEL